MELLKKGKEIFLRRYYSPDIYWWEWGLAVLVILLALLSCTYKDTVSLTVWSTNLWDVIAQGRLFDFYEYTARNIYGLPHDKMGCDLIAILPMSIWNIPIWIVQYFFHRNIVDSPVMLAWSKLGLAVSTVGVAYMAYKIAYLLVPEKKRCMWAVLLTMSSAVAIESVCIAGQNDVYFILYGAISVYCMMKNYNKRAVAFAALSVAVKPFFVFAYLPLVLLTEKNLPKAAAKCILSVSFMAAGRIIGMAFPMYSESMSMGPSNAVLYNLFSVGFETGGGEASVFVIGLMAICFIVFMLKPKDDEEKKKYILYIAAFVFLFISVFSYTDFYRSYLIMPYLSVLVVANADKFRVNIALMYVFQLFRMGCVSSRTRNGMNIYAMSNSVLSMVTKGSGYSQEPDANFKAFLDIINPHVSSFAAGVCSSFIVISAVILLVINHPRFNYKFDIEKDGTLAKYDHGFLILNILVFVPFLMIMFFLYFYPLENFTFRIVQ